MGASSKGAKRASKRARAKRQSRDQWLSRISRGLVFLAAGGLTAYVGYLLQPRMIMYFWYVAAGLMGLTAILLFLPKKLPGFFYVVMGLMSVLVFAFGLVFYDCIPVYGDYMISGARMTRLRVDDEYPENLDLMRKVETLDMRGSSTTDFEPIKGIKTLKSLDIRENYAFTQADCDALSRALPQANILWSMPLLGKYYDSDTRAIDLRDTPLTADAIRELEAEHPDITFTYAFDAPVAGLTSESESLTFEAGATMRDVRGCMEFFDWMPNMRSIDLTALSLQETDIDLIRAAWPDMEIKFAFSFYGIQCLSTDHRVVLDGIAVPSLESLEHYMAYMPNLRQLDMCYCGLSNDQMETLQNRHPDVKFVWVITFGHYRLRTDATMFSSMLWSTNPYRYSSEVYAPLKYCTDLMFLDLGHNHLTNISTIANFKKLRVLILADNRIRDISPLKDLEDLEYVELFTNKITDFSPLANKMKLRDLNVNCNAVSDISPFLTCTNLERLWIGSCGLSSAQGRRLKEGLPNAVVKYGNDFTPTEAGWRVHDHYYTIQKMYETKEYIPFPD